MAVIQLCPKARFRGNEFLAFCISIRDYIEEYNVDTSKFPSFYNTFSIGIDQLQNSLNRLSKSVYTKKLKEAKKKLNELRNGLFKKIQGDKGNLNEEIAQASKELMIVTDKFKKLNKLSFNEIIAKTESILAYFQSDKYKDYIKFLSLEQHVIQLQECCTSAKEISSKRIIENSSRNMIRSSEETRNELHLAYNLFVHELNFIARRDGDDDRPVIE